MVTPAVNPSSLQLIPVAEIHLDRENPRIRKFLEMYGEEPTPEQFYLALGAAGDEEGDHSATFEKLKNSIQTNGGIIQPIIINRKNGKFVCVEGNTRVALYKKFHTEKVKGTWTHIPALVYDNMDDLQIDSIRLQVHLVGTRQWDPYSKAKYLHSLRHDKGMPLAMVVEFCGGREKEVTEAINAYSDMETYYRPIVQEGNFDTSRFSGFVELQKPNIKQSIAECGYTLSDFATWIRDEKLYPLNTVRLLPRILRKQKAREAFVKYDARRAADLLDRPALSKALSEANLAQLANALTQAVYQLPWLEAEKLRRDSGGETAQLLYEALDALRGVLKSSQGSD
jgi:ParB/Sulfiredoxin domain